MTTSNDLLQIQGVGPKTVQYLNQFGIHNQTDLLKIFPIRYSYFKHIIDYQELQINDQVWLLANLKTLRNFHKGRLNITTAVFTNPDNPLQHFQVKWFNQPWVENKLKSQPVVAIAGTYQLVNKQLLLTNPNIIASWDSTTEFTPGTLSSLYIYPHYSSKFNIRPIKVKSIINKILISPNLVLDDWIPSWWLKKYHFLHLGELYRRIHLIENYSQQDLKLAQAQVLLRQILSWFVIEEIYFTKFTEFLVPVKPFTISKNWIRAQIDKLNFKLTLEQYQAILEIVGDYAKPKPAYRLLQGEVGSGKTVIALITALAVLRKSAKNVVFVVPTIILANQHYKFAINNLFEPYQVVLINKKTKNQEIKTAFEIDNSPKLIIATHSVFYDKLDLNDIGLVMIDEQQRFGVLQRQNLLKGNNHPHFLALTATPIPRTIAKIRFQNLPITTLKKGHLERNIVSKICDITAMLKILDKLVLSSPEKIMMIVPLIDSEIVESEYTIKYWKTFLDIRYNLNISIVTGRESAEANDQAIEAFENKKTRILLATNVLEVGFHQDDLHYLFVIGAERFGLASLHQIRGRVGRDGQPSECYFVQIVKEENPRLDILSRIDDGFKLAEEDLRLRGSGDLFGIRQSGQTWIDYASISEKVLDKMRASSKDLIKNLSKKEREKILDTLNPDSGFENYLD